MKLKNLMLTVLLLVTAQVFAQTEQLQLMFDRENKKYSTSMERFYQQKSITRTLTPQVLDEILDEVAYKVGPGDLFRVHIWGESEEEYDALVNPHGTIILSTVGEIFVDGLYIVEAREKIKTEIQARYRSGNISVNLVQLRKFRVYVTGEVNLPGTYFAQASDRVSDVIEVAEGITAWADASKIEIRAANGTTRILDINHFYENGSKDHNPYLHGGDVVFIPPIDMNAGVVTVQSNVEIMRASTNKGEPPVREVSNLLGVYPLVEGENIYDFLRKISAINRRSDIENIIIVRDDQELKVDLMKSSSVTNIFQLKNRDKILIPLLIDRVYVHGEVRNPGDFPYFAKLTAKDYVGKAGVLETGAGPNKYIVVRRDDGNYVKGADIVIEKGDTIIVPQRTREGFRDYFQIITPVLSLAVTIALWTTR